MAVKFRDYYEALGLSRQATDEQIRAAYRKCSFDKHHPDVNPGNKDAEEKFKEINEAYSVLSDPQKRKQYDALGQNGRRDQNSSLRRIGAAMCASTSEILAGKAISVSSLRVSSAGHAEAAAGGEPDLQLAAATWKPRSAFPLKKHTAARRGRWLFVAPMESRNQYASTFRPASQTENSSMSRMKASRARVVRLREIFSEQSDLNAIPYSESP